MTVASARPRLECFFDCSSLTSITLPESVTELGKSVFYGCDLSSLDFLNTGIMAKVVASIQAGRCGRAQATT